MRFPRRRRWRRRPHLSHITTCVVDHIRRGPPGATMNHNVECPLIESYIDRLGRDFIHLANVHVLPFDPLDFGVSLRHHLDNYG